MNLHEGHRERIKRRFAAEGLDSFEPHEALELLLFYALPRVDTNAVAHRLLRTFGRLEAVFDAPLSELVKVEGIGENAALLIKMIPAFSRAYHKAKTENAPVIDSVEKAGEYIKPFFIGRTNEMLYLLCIDGRCRVLGCSLVSEGDVESTGINVRRIIETAIRFNAASVVLAHNHPRHAAIPSSEDIEATKRAQKALGLVGIELIDHLIFADGLNEEDLYGDYVSLAQSGQLSR